MATNNMTEDVHDYNITNIRAGKGVNSNKLYACLCDGDQLLMMATLEQITEDLESLLIAKDSKD